jgi:hypothetical protein
VHLHWRWGGVAGDSAPVGRAWQFRGWDKGGVRSTSRATGLYRASAHSLSGAPLLPPNQRLMFALCEPTATRHSADHVINPASPQPLDALRKLYWYCTDVIQPHFEQRQVLFEHGIGWAYRYAVPEESDAVGNLEHGVFLDPLPWTGVPTQQEMMEFFQEVYEVFRYRDAPHVGSCVDAVPQGTFAGGAATAMEDL